jgi:hypothetical protein
MMEQRYGVVLHHHGTVAHRYGVVLHHHGTVENGFCIACFGFSFLKNLNNPITPCGKKSAWRYAICSER